MVLFVGGEIALFLIYKIVRGDFHMWYPIDGVSSIVASFLVRGFTKIVVDFTGCLQFRHPLDVGGLGFSVSMMWAQVVLFVALQFFNYDELKGIITIFLVCSFTLWLLLNIVFFCS